MTWMRNAWTTARPVLAFLLRQKRFLVLLSALLLAALAYIGMDEGTRKNLTEFVLLFLVAIIGGGREIDHAKDKAKAAETQP